MRSAIDVRRAALILLALAGASYPGWLAVGSFVEPAAVAQEKKEAEKPKKGAEIDEPITKTPFYFGAKSCSSAGCHGGTPPADWPLPLLCKCDEYKVWQENDKHADAYNVLLRDRGKRMSKLLGYEVSKDPKCLSCHAVVIEDTVGFKNGKEIVYKGDDIKKSPLFTLTEGVSCTVCHGSYLEWEERHKNQNRLDEWRPLTRTQKEHQFGMTDLWNPTTRTKLCASCHIGNVKEGKEVTHDMYAAGHPPLPGFEAAIFSDEMPRHWKYLGQKSEAVQKAQRYDGKREPTQLLLVGAAVSLGETLRLIAAQAGAKKNEGDPELAMFDCYSCHHEIRSPSWRLTKPAVEKPGRVPMRTWPLELVRLAVWHLEQDGPGAKSELAKLNTHTAALRKAFISKQLGDAHEIAAEAKRFADWADELAVKLHKSEVNEEAAKRLLRHLPTMFAKETLDFDSARQVAWGYQVLSRDLGADKDKPTPALADLEKYLDLRLPKGRMMKDDKASPLERELGKRMRGLYDYEPKDFRDLLGKLGGGK